MRATIITFLLCISTTAYNQENNWSQSETQVLEQFDLSSKDGRGVVFTFGDNGCSEVFPNEKEAIIDFFTDQVKFDIRSFCVKELKFTEIEEGKIYEIKEIVELFLQCK